MSWPFYPHLPRDGSRSRQLAHPVAIIGGGIAGLSLALSLQRAGLPFVVFERDAEALPRFGYGITLQATSSLRDLGILDAVYAKTLESVSTEHWTFSDSGSILGYFGRGLSEAPPRPTPEAAAHADSVERGNIRIPREDLLKIMREALRPGSVRYGVCLAGIREEGELVRLEFEGGAPEPLLASVIVGADGLRSRVRALALGRAAAPTAAPLPAPLELSHLGVVLILGLSTCQHPLLASRGFYTINGSHRLFTMPYAPATAERPSLTMWQLSFASQEHTGSGEAVEAAARDIRRLPSAALLSKALAAVEHWHSPCSELLAASVAGSVWATSLVDLGGRVAVCGLPNVTLVGDAAHPMSPFKGQGANQALMDGPLLAAWLCKAAVPAAIKAYEREMRIRAERKTLASRSAALHLHSPAVLTEAAMVSGVEGGGAAVKLVLEEARRRGLGASMGGELTARFRECLVVVAADGAAGAGGSASVAPSSPPPPVTWTMLYYCYCKLGVDGRAAVLEWLSGQEGPAAGGCVGRIRVGLDGVNACLGAASKEALLAHAAALPSRAHPTLTASAAARPIDFKLAPSAGPRSAEAVRGCCFDGPVRLVSCSEIVTLGLTGEDPAPAERGGKHLPPASFHALLTGAREGGGGSTGSDGAGAQPQTPPLVMIDVRNAYEHAVGTFAPPPGVKLLLPPVKTFAEMPAWLASADVSSELSSASKVLTFCTGGVRCERFTSLLRERFPSKEIFQLEGGIQRYMEAGEKGLLGGQSAWAGRLFVFDERPPVRLAGCLEEGVGGGGGACSDGSSASASAGAAPHKDVVLGRCLLCSAPWDQYLGWLRCAKCGMLVLVCQECQGLEGGGAARERELLEKLMCEVCKHRPTQAAQKQQHPKEKKERKMREGRKRERGEQ